jgi:hypothetical protein
MVSGEEKTRENYYRRMAKRLGLELKRSKGKKWSIYNQKKYMIMNALTGEIIAGEKYDLELESAIAILAEFEKNLTMK